MMLDGKNDDYHWQSNSDIFLYIYPTAIQNIDLVSRYKLLRLISSKHRQKADYQRAANHIADMHNIMHGSRSLHARMWSTPAELPDSAQLITYDANTRKSDWLVDHFHDQTYVIFDRFVDVISKELRVLSCIVCWSWLFLDTDFVFKFLIFQTFQDAIVNFQFP